MIGNRKLFVNDYCEVKDLILPYIDGSVGKFSAENVVPGAIYLLSWFNFLESTEDIRKIAETQQAIIVLSNPVEGSETMVQHIRTVQMKDLVVDKKILIIGGGDIEPEYPCLTYDRFPGKMLTYGENVEIVKQSHEIYNKKNKPYKFLFLNGALRPHRKYLLERWEHTKLLNQSLWTCLTTDLQPETTILSYLVDKEDLVLRPRSVKYLDSNYEVAQYSPNTGEKLFVAGVNDVVAPNDWGAAHLKLAPYIDTYFSIVTETVFGYPYSFRTEKIWKPISIGHPWIAVANRGFYRDLRNLGFKTFNGIIDESFDLIDNNQRRIQRIAQVVENLCRQDLVSFLDSCQSICAYNQQRFDEFIVEERDKFPSRLEAFIGSYYQIH